MTRVRSWFILGFSLILVVLTACSPASSDEAAQDQVLADYLAAVQAGDQRRMAELCQPGVDATADIAAVVAKIGDRQWHQVSVTWRRGEFPGVAVAQITATDPDGAPITDSVTLTKVDERWWIGIGSAPIGPAGPPARTTRPG